MNAGTVAVALEFGGYRVTPLVKVNGDGTVEVVSIEGISREDGERLTPSDMREVAADFDYMTCLAAAAVTGEEPGVLWLRHIEATVPKLPGQNKGQWIARVWRTYYEPTGRTLLSLSGDLGLSYETVRGYSSRYGGESK